MNHPDASRPTGLDPLFPIDAGALEALHQRLAQESARARLLDVAYRTVDSPIGMLLLAATPAGLVRIAFETEGFDAVVQQLADRLSPRILEAPARLDDAAQQLAQYFSGERHVFDLPLDHALSAGFRKTVHTWLPRISYGRTATYQEVAVAVGNPKAVRAVGTACATNPIPVVVPCHRVLRSDGSLGGYLGGVQAKSLLLDLEGAA